MTSSEYITGIMEDYDSILGSIDSNIEYSFPVKIKKRIKQQYDGKLSLPNSLSVDIVGYGTDRCSVNV